MKIIGLIALLNICMCSACNAQQPQQWGESPYDMETVDFGIDVAQFYSKAQDVTHASIEEIDKTKRHYAISENKHTEGDTILYDYTAPMIDYGEVLAKFGKYKFPYIGMLANKQGQMVGVMAIIRFKEGEQMDAFRYAVTDKFGKDYVMGEDRYIQYIWIKDDRRIQLSMKESASDGYKAHLMIVKREYSEIVRKTCNEGYWSSFTTPYYREDEIKEKLNK